MISISERHNASRSKLTQSFLSKIFLFLGNRLKALRYMCGPFLWGGIRNMFWTLHSLEGASMLMGRNRTLKGKMIALTLGSFRVGSSALRCGCQDSGLSSETNAFWSVHQAIYANRSRTRPNLPHQVNIGPSTLVPRPLLLLRSIGSLNVLKPTNTWYVNDYFL